MTNLIRDENHVTIAGGASNTDSTTVLPILIDSVTGRVLVDGSTLTQEAPVGTVDGSNNTYTVSNTPIFIVVDGQVRPSVSNINDINGNGFTYSGGTITVNSLVPPVSFIRSYHL